MDFFQRQDKARRKTKLLIFYFIVAVILLIALAYAASLAVFNYLLIGDNRHHYYETAPVILTYWNPKLLLGVTIGTLAVIFGGSAYKTMQLSGGGGSVATTLGGRLVSSSTTDADERKLLNVVEEMAIASGVPVPQVYVLDDERAINAFAAGHTPSDAAIGVTRGAIQLLSRDELQGVIGHEFSHILNGDMRLNLRLIGIIFGLLCIATIGRILLSARSRNSRDKNPLPLIGLILLLLGSIGVFFGRLIQAAVSRQREFLADASSVQFTRNPAGLSGALQKIGRYGFGSRLENDHAPDMCHMFFGNGLGEALFGMMATHPPIPDRIRAIDPAWDGKFPPLDEKQVETVRQAAYAELKRPPMPDAFRTILGGAIIASENTPPPIRPQTIMPNIGSPKPLHLRYAEELREAMPDSVKDAAHNPLDAVALIYALLLNKDETVRAKQLDGLKQRAAAGIAEKATALYPDVAATSARARLPMVNITLGALRELSRTQFEEFSRTLKWLIESDSRIELFELVLQKIVLHHLAPKFSDARPPVIQYYTIKPLVPDCVLLLSALANVGNSEVNQIQSAFAAGAPYLRAPDGAELQLLPRERCGVAAVDAALNRLALSVPLIKKNLLEACVQTIGADGVVRESEAELLRAIADTLDCPMPPLVADV